MIPFLEVSKLSDEDIIDRLSKARQYRAYQHQMGHTPTVESIDAVIHALEEEQESRFQRRIREDAVKKNINPYQRIELGKMEQE